MIGPEKQPPSGEREISSGVIVFKKSVDGPRFLALYYGHNYWTFPRGKIEKEERSFEAALRETFEETGLVRGDLRFVDYFKTYENWTFTRNGKKVRKTVIFYLAETHHKIIQTEKRCFGYGWFTAPEMMKLLVGPKNEENRKVIKRVWGFLSGKKKPKTKPLGKQQEKEAKEEKKK